MEETAKYLEIKVPTLYKWVHIKLIPYYKIGRLNKFKIKEIERWLESRKVMSV